MHVSESQEANAHTRDRGGTTFVRYLDRLGAVGPWLLAAHATWVDREEMALLAEKQSSVSHCPVSNLRVLGMPHAADMVDAGVNVSLGTDSAGVNNRMSLIDEMWVASILQKGLRLDPTVFDARTMLSMATRNGARALHLADRTGSLEAGKSADLVLIDPRTVNMIPLNDPVSALVSCMKSENVDSVMCDGKWLMRQGVITVCDESEVLHEAGARASHLARAVGL
jgi:5-methylthioadenosine/S-adenosylhomocysteine deaminase